MSQERTLPFNLEAERSVLGAVFIDNAALHAALEVIGAGDFYRDAHRRIFSAMCRLFERNTEIDFVTLKDELGAKDLQEVGGPAYISSLADGIPRASNVVYHARIIREKATLRSLIYAATKVLTNAYEADDSSDQILDQAEATIFQVADRRLTSGFKPMASVATANFAKLEAIFEHKALVTGVPTGFVELDEMTRGLQPGNLVIIAGRPSMGKTSLVLNIAQHVATHHHAGGAVGFFSLEMSEDELFLRLLADLAQIDLQRLTSGLVAQRDFGRISHALEQIHALPLHIDDTAGIGVLEMRAKARRLKAAHGLSLIVIDYIQLMTTSDDYENRNLQLGGISRSLKGLAKELDVPVVVLSQLSRGPEQRADHRPMLSDLRESGALEQDADLVGFVYRDEVYNPKTDDKGIAELIIAKQRNGPTGTVKLAFIREQTRFANLAA